MGVVCRQTTPLISKWGCHPPFTSFLLSTFLFEKKSRYIGGTLGSPNPPPILLGASPLTRYICKGLRPLHTLLSNAGGKAPHYLSV